MAYYAVTRVLEYDDIEVAMNGIPVSFEKLAGEHQPDAMLPLFRDYEAALAWADGDSTLVLTFKEPADA